MRLIYLSTIGYRFCVRKICKTTKHSHTHTMANTRAYDYRRIKPCAPVVDFSFCDIVNITDALEEEPRNGQLERHRLKKETNVDRGEYERASDTIVFNNISLTIQRGPKNLEEKQKQEAAKLEENAQHSDTDSLYEYSDEEFDGLDLGFDINESLAQDIAILTNMSGMTDLVPYRIRRKNSSDRDKHDPRYIGSALKLSNNALSNLAGAEQVFSSVMVQGLQLTWIDLSYNCIESVRHILEHLHFLSDTLKVLYLHANQISDPDEIIFFAHFHGLRALSLYGNPVDQIKNYRFYVLALLPNLRNLDFIAITRGDQENAATLKSIFIDPYLEKQTRRRHNQTNDDIK